MLSLFLALKVGVGHRNLERKKRKDGEHDTFDWNIHKNPRFYILNLLSES
jgi:hypothetical protein